jgi:hypothetical protein
VTRSQRKHQRRLAMARQRLSQEGRNGSMATATQSGHPGVTPDMAEALWAHLEPKIVNALASKFEDLQRPPMPTDMAYLQLQQSKLFLERQRREIERRERDLANWHLLLSKAPQIDETMARLHLRNIDWALGVGAREDAPAEEQVRAGTILKEASTEAATTAKKIDEVATLAAEIAPKANRAAALVAGFAVPSLSPLGTGAFVGILATALINSFYPMTILGMVVMACLWGFAYTVFATGTPPYPKTVAVQA